ncbi:ribosome assembly RNA-binding protein YhbY [Thiomicrorhabdus sediminis]|uniref:Ribosome assembly RNA-binding protein YhbY n=1 Tax=Thiomicrorhabdus sediminis TaxID=2580412 RepID=A0A4P9K4A2_9GAMM|nr:ribosome assembly RNA-binding protein YhbY [Thiomicrorhabdus sediminis]QCU89755.1 ribosome assembly RNA-binding protein YhbY [Thiomicrorhabdus sediminis]
MSQPEKLSKSQEKFLKGIAHHINPMIIIGAKGVTDSLMKELDKTLEHHELLKIKIAIGDRDDRKQIVDHIIDQTGALLVQSIGKTVVIFRQSEESEFSLPK